MTFFFALFFFSFWDWKKVIGSLKKKKLVVGRVSPGMASVGDGLEREELEKEVLSLRNALEERENEVMKAGLFGKELLQHNSALLSQVEELKEKSVSIDEHDELKEAQVILLQKLEEMREKLQDSEKLVVVEEEGGVHHLQEELAREHKRVEVEKEKQKQMMEDFRELEGRLLAQIDEAKRVGEEEGNRIREEEMSKALVIQRENEVLRRERIEGEEILKGMKKEKLEAEKKLVKLRGENRELREEAQKLKGMVQELKEKKDSLVNRRESEVKEGRDEVEKMKGEYMAARIEVRKMQQSYLALREENAQLVRDQEENQAVLDATKEKVRKMQIAMDENKVHNNTSHSAIWELEKGLNTLLSQKNASPDYPKPENSPQPGPELEESTSSPPRPPTSPSTNTNPPPTKAPSSPPLSSPPTPKKPSPSRSSPGPRPKPKPKPKPKTASSLSKPPPSPTAKTSPKPKPKAVNSPPKSPSSSSSKPASPAPKAVGAKPRVKGKAVVKKPRKEVVKDESEDGGGEGMLLEEYFHLAASAVKITMATAHPHASDTLLKISSNSLFEECVAQNIPFHIWHDWIHSTLLGLLNLDKKTDQEKK